MSVFKYNVSGSLDWNVSYPLIFLQFISDVDDLHFNFGRFLLFLRKVFSAQ